MQRDEGLVTATQPDSARALGTTVQQPPTLLLNGNKARVSGQGWRDFSHWLVLQVTAQRRGGSLE
jgi:hypothetical protein